MPVWRMRKQGNISTLSTSGSDWFISPYLWSGLQFRWLGYWSQWVMGTLHVQRRGSLWRCLVCIRTAMWLGSCKEVWRLQRNDCDRVILPERKDHVHDNVNDAVFKGMFWAANGGGMFLDGIRHVFVSDEIFTTDKRCNVDLFIYLCQIETPDKPGILGKCPGSHTTTKVRIEAVWPWSKCPWGTGTCLWRQTQALRTNFPSSSSIGVMMVHFGSVMPSGFLSSVSQSKRRKTKFANGLCGGIDGRSNNGVLRVIHVQQLIGGGLEAKAQGSFGSFKSSGSS